MRIGIWLFRALIFILVILLIFNNNQKITFSLIGIYQWNLPLIAVCFGFLILGMAIGLIYSFFNNIELRAKIKLLQSDLANARKPHSSND